MLKLIEFERTMGWFIWSLGSLREDGNHLNSSLHSVIIRKGSFKCREMDRLRLRLRDTKLERI